MMRCLAASLLPRKLAGHFCPPELSVVLPTARRLLHTSPVVAMGHGSHASDNNPEVLEREKQRSLTGEWSWLLLFESAYAILRCDGLLLHMGFLKGLLDLHSSMHGWC